LYQRLKQSFQWHHLVRLKQVSSRLGILRRDFSDKRVQSYLRSGTIRNRRRPSIR
jgi:hypothetical protein